MTMNRRSDLSALERLTRLERRTVRSQALRLIVAVLALAACAGLRAGGSAAPAVPRVKLLIVEDAQGRPRVVLGAPLNKVPGRRRTDDAFGLLLLGENGADRIV